jgi:hypothetical protein
MTDERVDELLKDLDAALSVQPSPSVAARVRIRIDQPSGRRVGAWRQLTTVATLVAVAAVTYGVWRRVEPASGDEPPQALATQALPAITTGSAPSRRQPGDSVDGPSHLATRVVPAQRRAGLAAPVRAAEPREPEVIVSPQVRLAFEQLQAAARSGRLTAESFASTQPAFEPVVLTPTAIEIRPLEIEIVPVYPADAGPHPDGPGGSGRQPGPIWPSGPLSRTRSTS